MANNYRVVRVIENIAELETEVNKLLDQGWKLAGGITVTLGVGLDYSGSVPTLVYLQAMTREE